MKRTCVILLAAALLLTALGACAGGQNTSQPESSAPESSTPVSSAPAESESPKEEPTMTPEPAKAIGYEYDHDTLQYELVWSDEFDYEGKPDPEKWNYDTGGSGWGNNELQTYTAGDNAEVTDGKLIIELRSEPVGENSKRYTSTRMITFGKEEWLYGKFEISAKLPAGLGTWPAFWMMPAHSAYGGWPNSGEIDIMEHVGFDQDVVVQTVHNTAYHAGDGKGKSTPTAGVSEGFHTYAVEWLPDKLIFSIDGEESFVYDPTEYSDAPTKEIWPYDQPFYLLLNLAFGGNWGGAQGTDDSYFPVQYEVEYVRVYQSPEITALTQQAG